MPASKCKPARAPGRPNARIGACSIWSLDRRLGTEEGAERLLTVEVDKNNTIVQARGRANRWPTEQEKRVLGEWIRTAGLKPGPYLYGW